MAAQASRMECWWMISVAVEVFDEFLSVVTWSTRGFQDEWGQVDTGLPVELFLVFSVGHETWAGAGCPNESCVGRKRRDHRRVNVIRVAAQVEHDIHPCPFGLCAGLGLTWEA